MKVCLVIKPGHEDSGVGRYAVELASALTDAGVQVVVTYPVVPLPEWFVQFFRHVFGWDLEAFFCNYPFWARYPEADLYHLTSQNLATLLLLCRPPGKTVVTIHDIIPWLVRDIPTVRIYNHSVAEGFDRLALTGLRQADRLVSVSQYTQASLRRPKVAVGKGR